MKKKCKTCPNAVQIEDLKRCQSKRCRPKGAIYCGECISQQAGDFMNPFFCKKCHPDNQKKKRARPAVKAERKPVDETGWCHRLVRLRNACKLTQPEMAKVLGTTRRSYQEWEYGDHDMLTVTKISCWHLARAIKPKLAKQWPEGKEAEKLINERVKR